MNEGSCYYVYLLRCVDNSLYTGVTTTPARRFSEHSSRGKKSAGYTFSHHAVSVAAVFKAGNRSEALRCEYRIKKLSKEVKETLVSNGAAFTYDNYIFPRIATDGRGNFIDE